MEEKLKLLLELAYEARRKLLEFEGKPEALIKVCQHPNDITWGADVIAEKAIIGVLREKNIPTLLISESSIKLIGVGEPEIILVADPLDGTNNFINSIPFSSISLAAAPFNEEAKLNDVSTGVVMGVHPKCTYYAIKGGGAFKDGGKISAGVETPSKIVSFYGECKLGKLVKTRKMGCASLEICYVADGTFNAFIDVRGKLRVTDFAAAFLVLKEAGGTLTDVRGKALNTPLKYRGGLSIVASKNLKVQREILNFFTNFT